MSITLRYQAVTRKQAASSLMIDALGDGEPVGDRMLRSLGIEPDDSSPLRRWVQAMADENGVSYDDMATHVRLSCDPMTCFQAGVEFDEALPLFIFAIS